VLRTTIERILDTMDLAAHLESYTEKFGFLQDLVVGMVDTSYVNTVLCSGPPGIGKTYSIDKLLQSRSESPVQPIRYKRVSGKITPLQFYHTLVENSSHDSVLFFDDADTILHDPVSLNLLKEASEKRNPRVISYNSSKLDGSGSVVFDGKIVISTNMRISRNEHYTAVCDRFHVFDMDVSYLEKLAKIYDIAQNAPTTKVSREMNLDIVKFLADMEARVDVDKVTIRTFVKLQELSVLMPQKWKRFAEVSGTYFEGKKTK
jgi:ferritin-like protein